MKIILTVIFLFLTCINSYAGTSRYVATTGTDSGNCSNIASPCLTLAYAITQMVGGDDLYLRGGTYHEHDLLLANTLSGSSGDYTSIQSYPGEWAIVDGDRSCTRANSNSVFTLGGSSSYIKFERLEIMGGGYTTQPAQPESPGGISAWEKCHHITIRYCYIHDNLGNYDSAGWSGGIIAREGPSHWLIEYNYLKNNGIKDDPAAGYPPRPTHSAQIAFLSDYAWTCSPDCPTNMDYALHSNIIRYNYFEDTLGYSNMAIYYKGTQMLVDPAGLSDVVDATWEWKDYGDDIHHNIINGTGWVFRDEQDYTQFHHNITYNVSNSSNGEDGPQLPPTYAKAQTAIAAYNNTIVGGRLYGAWYDIAKPLPHMYWFNNLLDTPDGSGDVPAISVANNLSFTPNFVRINFENNYLYRQATSYQVKVGSVTDVPNCKGALTLAQLNTCDSSTNYAKASSEGSDNLYDTGYITRGAHVVSGSTTIANGGRGSTHPYLTGVNIPSFIGATNPSDNVWVPGVLGLNSTYFTGVTAGSTPSWIEGSGQTIKSITIGAGSQSITIGGGSLSISW